MTLRTLGAPGLLLAAAQALAGQAADSLSRPDTVFAVEPLLVTASRLPSPGTGLGITLTSLEPTPRRSPFALESLRGVPGAFVDEASGPGGPTIVRLRGGEEIFTLVLVDGVAINQNGGFFDFQGLSLANLGRVDVARGPQSAVYGSSAVSGVVHFLTPRGPAGPPAVEARLEGGDAADHGGSWTADASVRGGSERFRYSVGAGAAFWRGVFALPHDTRTENGALRLDWAPAPGWEATLTGRRVQVSSKLPVRDAGATRVPLDPNARNDRDRDVAGVTLRHTPSARWSHYLRLSRYGEAFVYEDAFDGVSAPPGESFFVFDANLRFTSDLIRRGVEVGGGYDGGAVRAAWGVAAEDESLEDRITGDFGGDPLVLDRSMVAGFGEVAWSPSPTLTLGAGLRVEGVEGLDAEATPRASLTWTPDGSGVSLRAAAGRAYKVPNLQQQYVDNPFIVANPELRPETSTSVEAGVAWAAPDGGWRLGLTAFRQDFDDLIRTVAQEGDTRQINRNLGRARATGVEWEGWARLGGAWWLSGGGSLLSTEILDAGGLSAAEYPEGAGLPFRPSHTGELAVAYRGAGGAEVALRARGVGGQTVLSERFSGRRVELPGYVLLGLSAAYPLGDALEAYARFDNLADRVYQTAFDRPGMPASGALGVVLRF